MSTFSRKFRSIGAIAFVCAVSAMCVESRFALADESSENASRAPKTAPLGLELGVTTRQEVEALFGEQLGLEYQGISLYTEGPILKGSGAQLPFEGAKSSLFVFDADNRLAFLSITMNKSQRTFESMEKGLKSKYKLLRRVAPFVGNRFARFQSGAVFIELDAPHLSFDMFLSYQTLAFEKAYLAEQARQKKMKANAQNNAL
jgi:hypothetical protein